MILVGSLRHIAMFKVPRFYNHCLYCKRKYLVGAGKDSPKDEKNWRYCSQTCVDQAIARRALRKRIPLLDTIRRTVMRRDNNTCRYCGDKANCVDHIEPVCRGGKNDLDNLVACCTTCNGYAGGKQFNSFEAKRLYVAGKPPEKLKSPRPKWHQVVYGSLR